MTQNLYPLLFSLSLIATITVFGAVGCQKQNVPPKAEPSIADAATTAAAPQADADKTAAAVNAAIPSDGGTAAGPDVPEGEGAKANVSGAPTDSTVEEDPSDSDDEIRLNPDGYTPEMKCAHEGGCPCGDQRCPLDFLCDKGMCIQVEISEFGDIAKEFYCSNSGGCLCGKDICPKNAFCLEQNNSPDWSDSTRFTCLFIEGVRDAESAYQYLLNEAEGVVDDEERGTVVFQKEFYKNAEGFTLYQADATSLHVLCDTPACDCAGVPLAEGYLCVKQHVVFAIKDSRADSGYGVCHSPFVGYTFDRLPEYCDISQDVVEQVCVRDGGCACGVATIAKGDVCANGKAQCSATNARPGCTCGDATADKGYGCLHGELVCQAGISIRTFDEDATCTCHGKDIRPGDTCGKKQVVCGADSDTEGCVCDKKVLRDGYRCFQKKQICDCSEGDDCTCKCGKKDIRAGDECRDDDTPVVIPPAETKEAANGDELLKCGDHWVNVGNYEYSARGVIHLNDPEDRKQLCTCGTGEPAPGEGYGCAFKHTYVGNGSEWHNGRYLDGWTCLNPVGCRRGNTVEYPAFCDGEDMCLDDLTIKVSAQKDCGGNKLPESVPADGYVCFDANPMMDVPQGWYCAREQGCACGNAQCGMFERCIEPGKCSAAAGTLQVKRGENSDV